MLRGPHVPPKPIQSQPASQPQGRDRRGNRSSSSCRYSIVNATYCLRCHKEGKSVMAALNNGLRSASKLLAASETVLSKSVNRGFHSTGMKRMSGGHGHGHDEPYYLHAKHMYNLDRMKGQKIKMPLAVFTAFSIGAGVPVFAVIFQQKKTASA